MNILAVSILRVVYEECRKRLNLPIILMLGLMVRLIFFAVFPDLNFPDADVYRATGKFLFQHGIMSTNDYMPLYPIITQMATSAFIQKLLDIGLSTATIGIVYQLTGDLYQSKNAAILSALCTAFYPFFIFYAASGLSESSYIFFMMASFLCFYRQKFSCGIALWILSLLVRPIADFLAPFLIVGFVAIVHRGPWRKSLQYLGLYAVIYTALMAPWWVSNYHKYGQFVRLTLGMGHVLYAGNNPLNTSGGGVNTPGHQDVDYSQFDGISDPIAREQAKIKSAVDYIQANPARFIHMAGVKFIRFWRLWPYASEFQQPLYVIVSVLSYGGILLFALAYLIRYAVLDITRLFPIILYILYLMGVHMVTIASIRYRLPIEPFLIIFACRYMTVCPLFSPRGENSSIGRVADTGSHDK